MKHLDVLDARFGPAVVLGGLCLMRASVGDIHAARGADSARQIYEECARIAADNGFPPSDKAREAGITNMTTPGSPLTASMLRDIENHGRTEVEQILADLLNRRKTPPAGLSLLATARLHVEAYEARRKRELNH